MLICGTLVVSMRRLAPPPNKVPLWPRSDAEIAPATFSSLKYVRIFSWKARNSSGVMLPSAPPRPPAPRPPRPPPAGISSVASSVSSSGLYRRASAVVGKASSGGVTVRTHLPASLPWNFSMSLAFWMTASIASPVWGPLVPPVHATGIPMMGMYPGSTIAPLNDFTCQPGIGLSLGVAHFSRRTFASPHSFICLTAQSPAMRYWGELVRRGPYWSVSLCISSMTLELLPNSSVLIL